ncbi:unnamed protein product [Pleuronectes platessa]|uniref:Uncharacterized protein n=1 Tax=Pleuronectes platessa TaxID=8262 RepID=A0A9N7YRV7_PLEPL|nr:unnamed protein product [Pleuronectes platessa]
MARCGSPMVDPSARPPLPRSPSGSPQGLGLHPPARCSRPITPTATLVSYIQKKNRNLVLLSTRHVEVDVSDSEDGKLVIVLDYNRNKGGVDHLGDRNIELQGDDRACPLSSSTTYSTTPV